MEEFLEAYMPSFVGSFGIDEFSHLDVHQKKNLTRETRNVRPSLISGKPINIRDSHITLERQASPLNPQGCTLFVSLEDALNLKLCMPFNPLSMEKRERFNPYQLCHAQQASAGRLDAYI